jgi:hypothetical protein
MKTAVRLQQRRRISLFFGFSSCSTLFLVKNVETSYKADYGDERRYAYIHVCQFCGSSFFSVPLGQRRRFGPAPAEDIAPPQLAQPSPSAYPRPPQQDPDSPGRGRDDSPVNGAAGKLNELENNSRLPFAISLSLHSNLTAALETLYSSHLHACPRPCYFMPLH